MVRKKIEISPGAIAPTGRTLWSAAIEKLEEANVGLLQMKAAQDRVSYEQGWTRFVDSLEEFWTRFFDEGKALFSDFQPWGGAIEAERKADQLLAYLYQARHQSQHGRIALIWDDAQLLIAPGFNGHIRNLQVFQDGTFEMDSVPLHPSVPEATVRLVNGKARLPVIVNKKFKQEFPPPLEHLGKTIECSEPAQVAGLGIDYYGSVLEKVFKKFGRVK